MPHKGPHISIAPHHLVPRALGLPPDEFRHWPDYVRELAEELAEELFLVHYNPFVSPDLVRVSVQSRFEQARPALAQEYALALETAVRGFWTEFEEDARFREEVIRRLGRLLPRDCVDLRRNTLVEFSTDATDLRMELPMLAVAPRTGEQVRQVVLLANEMGFAIVPRGGGSGLTGGAVPARRRAVVLSLSKLKAVTRIDPREMVLCAEAGVITQDAIDAARRAGMLFTVDPASRSASSLGGNISENSGGPFAFEYGTTLDCIISYRMVTPLGGIIEVRRTGHPRRKILSEDTAVFEVLDESGALLDTVSLAGDQIRGPGLGKDVTNKYLGGLPGVQKEGVDGVITEACFACHPLQAHSRTLCLEFYGRTMHNAMLVIKDLVALRDAIRREGDLVKMSALEEFGSKYVQAIEYRKKSERYEGDPISVLLIQLDSDHVEALDSAVARIVEIVEPYDNCDAFTARDQKEADLFWEDRHKLSAISRRTSGFKINEDIVIPIEAVPEFADFLEGLNLAWMARAYRSALQEVGRLPGVAFEDRFINMEFTFASRIIKGEQDHKDLSDQELEIQTFYFFKDLKSRYPDLEEELDEIYRRMAATRIVIANHMHAGDGNCHVNIPVNSNDPAMLAHAEEAAGQVFERVLELRGEVSGEHGIGITKIGYLAEEKLTALRVYKERVDPRGVLNPGKLTRRELPVRPYTFSFNRLIQDLRKTGLPDKERLINLLANVQICNRCGKCKQVCPMYHPERSLLYHPRNKNISLGALIEAVYYSQVQKGEPDRSLLDELRRLVEHCTGCGKCTAICPVKVDSPGAALEMRAFLEDKGSGGHPIKMRILKHLARDPSRLAPRAAKAASLLQAVQNKAVGLTPSAWRDKFQSPALSGPGPVPGFANLAEALRLERGALFTPDRPLDQVRETVIYFPGCGASLFYRDIGLAAVALLLEAGVAVALPPEHLCCGYPLLASGAQGSFQRNRARVAEGLAKALDLAQQHGLAVSSLLTACGTCRDGLTRLEVVRDLRPGPEHLDVTQYLFQRLEADPGRDSGVVLYHGSCHAEWTGVPAARAAQVYAGALAGHGGVEVRESPGCCGESGLGALTSPEIYNKLRERKQARLAMDLEECPPDTPVVVGCPSCRVGIARSLMRLGRDNLVLHTLEYLAAQRLGAGWSERLRKALAHSHGPGPRRIRFP